MKEFTVDKLKVRVYETESDAGEAGAKFVSEQLNKVIRTLNSARYFF